MRIKRIKKLLTQKDVIDLTIFIKNNQVIKFALNYRAKIKNKWYEVYRVDNYHGFLHEQKLWRSKKPIPLNYVGLNNKDIIKIYNKFIGDNFHKMRLYYENSKKRFG